FLTCSRDRTAHEAPAYIVQTIAAYPRTLTSPCYARQREQVFSTSGEINLHQERSLARRSGSPEQPARRAGSPGVAPAGPLGRRGAGDEGFRVQPLDDLENLRRTVAVAGCTPVLSLWARAAERWHPGLRVCWSFANSTEALHALARGEVHAAGLHLHDPRTG